MHWTQRMGKSNGGFLARCEHQVFSSVGGKPMRRFEYTYCKIGGLLLAATTVVGLTIGTILAQSNPPGSAVSTEEQPIKRTVLFRGELEGAPGKEIVIFIADLAPGAVGAKHYHPGPEF